MAFFLYSHSTNPEQGYRRTRSLRELVLQDHYLYVRFLFSAVCACVICLAADGSRAEYVGGTVASVPLRTRGAVVTTDERYVRFTSGKAAVSIPYERVNLLEYGQKVDRRYALGVLVSPVLLLSKKRQHFLTLGYADDEGRQQALVFRVDKSDIRALLVTLEARTGRRVAYQDENARKAGKG